MSRTDKDLHWSRREWPGWVLRRPYAMHLALSHSRPDDRRTYGWGPDRARCRTACQKARSEYNATGDTDVEVPTQQHRHGVDWLVA